MEVESEETSAMAVRALGRITDKHIGYRIFLIQKILAISRTYAEDPGMPRIKDLKAESPLQHSGFR